MDRAAQMTQIGTLGIEFRRTNLIFQLAHVIQHVKIEHISLAGLTIIITWISVHARSRCSSLHQKLPEINHANLSSSITEDSESLVVFSIFYISVVQAQEPWMHIKTSYIAGL